MVVGRFPDLPAFAASTGLKEGRQMAKRKHTLEQVINKLRQAEVALA